MITEFYILEFLYKISVLNCAFQCIWCCRYYSTLLQSLMECDEDTVEVVRAGLVARLGPDMATLFQLLQNKPCPPEPAAAGSSGMEGHTGFRWPPMFKIQPNLRNRDPTHLFARKRSVEGSS